MDSIFSWFILLILAAWGFCRMINRIDAEREKRRMNSELAWREFEKANKSDDWETWKEVNNL